LSARAAIAVFGSSEPAAGDPLYESARRVGVLLVHAGYDVVTGGYGGVMEGASRGAVEAGGRSIGVTCSIFAARTPNLFLSAAHDTPDLVTRMAELVRRADGYVILHGKSGTLAELTLLWALHRAGSLGPRPVILLGAAWRPFLHHLVKGNMIESAELAITRVADEPEEAVGWIDTLLFAEGGRGE
jgi:uncharacterized protein (TIGR00730 family)